ncbi:MAG: DUF1559 domain-containing protein, partial [Bryobacteraceae bacterium]|nr:DUF1559 domain-containing protein [Bryobacteraceae bacterium]
PPPAGARPERAKMHTWISSILPFFEQQALYDQTDFKLPAWGQPIVGTVVPTLLCPSDDAFGREPSQTHGIAVTHYIASEGWHWWAGPAVPGAPLDGVTDYQGIFAGNQSTNMSKITDGTSNTITVCENYSAGYKPLSDPWMRNGVGIKRMGNSEAVFRSAFVFTGMAGPCCEAGWYNEVDNSGAKAAWNWFRAGPHSHCPSYICAWGLNSEWPGAGSIHSGVVQAAFADGSVQAIGITIDYQTWCALNGMKDKKPVSGF